MTWAQRLKKVFNIDVESCVHCGGPAKVIACIEDPVVIKKILASPVGRSPISRARPVAREPGAAAGWIVQLTLGKPITLCNWLRL